MTRTQIQLPDEVYLRARRLCDAREISFAELARRGIEYMLDVYPPADGGERAWSPPTPQACGFRGLSDREIKELAQESTVDAEIKELAQESAVDAEMMKSVKKDNTGSKRKNR